MHKFTRIITALGVWAEVIILAYALINMLPLPAIIGLACAPLVIGWGILAIINSIREIYVNGFFPKK